VRLRELRSVAIIVSRLARLPDPSRDVKRSYVLIVKWFAHHWPVVRPWLAVVQLRDADDRLIDGHREMDDRGLTF
jgi:hypothetical protein